MKRENEIDFNEKIDYISKLAMMKVDDSEKVSLIDEIGRLMTYFDMLDEVDTSNVEPMYQVDDEYGFMRQDEAYVYEFEKDSKRCLKFNEQGYIVVPKGEGV